jgi:hypothetical protein
MEIKGFGKIKVDSPGQQNIYLNLSMVFNSQKSNVVLQKGSVVRYPRNEASDDKKKPRLSILNQRVCPVSGKLKDLGETG